MIVQYPSTTEQTHSEATATLLPFGSTAILRIGMPLARVIRLSMSVLDFLYLRTCASSLPDSQPSFYRTIS